MPVINGVYLKDFTALPDAVTDANIIPIAISGNQVAYRTTVGGIVTDARVTGKLLTGLSVTGGAIASTDSILTAFGKVQNQLNSKVSSVGLTMPSAFSVANSPVTSSGTLAVTANGLASQYIRGDGQLADFPTGGGGGGSSVSYYLNGSVNQGTFGGNVYKEMNKVPIFGAGTDFTINADGYIAQFLTDANDPNLLLIPAGNWNFETYFSASSGGGTPTFYVELYKFDGTTFSLIASNSAAPEFIAFGTTINPYFSALAVPETVLLATDRLAIRIYVTHSGRTITLHTENSNLCQIITTFTTGLQSLNGLTKQTQYFAVGSSGTDFNIASSVDTHTFNIPSASASNRGVITTGTQTIAGAKTFNTSATFSTSTTNAITANTTSGTAVSGTSSNYIGLQGSSTSGKGLVATSSTGIGAEINSGSGVGLTVISQSNDIALFYGASSALKASISQAGNITANSFIKSGGTSSQFLKADGSVDSTSYQPLLTNPVTGTGTTNYVPKFTGASSIGNSNLINDANGTLGLGVTPAAWSLSGLNAFQVTNAAIYGYQFDAGLTQNVYFNSSFKYINSGVAAQFQISGNEFYWKQAGSGTAGNAITFTQAMTLTNAGNLGIGTTSPEQLLTLNQSLNNTTIGLYNSNVTANNRNWTIGSNDQVYGDFSIVQSNANGGNPTSAGTRRFYINPSGNVGIGTTSPSGAAGLALAINGGASQTRIALKNSFTGDSAGDGFQILLDSGSADVALEIRETGSMRFATDSSERMRITSGGNVGIGTTSPTSLLSLGASFGASAGLSSNIKIATYDNGVAADRYGLGVSSSLFEIQAPENIGFFNGLSSTRTERMRITSGGNVLIGTTTDNGAKLQVSGQGRFTSNVIGIGSFALYKTDNSTIGGSLEYDSAINQLYLYNYRTDGFFSIYTNAAERLRITSGGNVGIGTTSPSSKLTLTNGSNFAHINGGGSSTVPFLGVLNSADYATATYGWGFFDNGTNGNLDLKRYNGSSTPIDAVTFQRSSGNVGIGTTSPATRLQIQDSSNTFVSHFSGNNQTNGVAIGTNSSNVAVIQGYTRTFSAINNISINPDGGNVGIGTTSPTAALTVSGTNVGAAIDWTNTTASTGRNFRWVSLNTGGFAIEDITAGSERMRITSAGNVGIGTTSPGAALEGWGAGDSPLRLRNTGATSGRFWKVGPDSGSNFVIYNENNTGAYINNTSTSWTGNSDIRLKNIIRGIDNATDSLMTLNPVIFSWKKDETNKENIGLIAQDVEKAFPQLIDLNNEGMLGVRYTELIPVLVKAIQEQQAQIEELKALINK